MSWIFLAEPANSDAPSVKPWLTTAYVQEWPPIVSESATLKGYFSQECFGGKSTERPSAPTSANSRAKDCSKRPASKALTHSSEASPARISASQALAEVWTGSEAVYSSRSSVLLANFDPLLLDWRTCQQSLFGGGGDVLARLPRWGIACAGELRELTILEERISAKGSGAWPTPQAAAITSSRGMRSTDKRENPNKLGWAVGLFQENLWRRPNGTKVSMGMISQASALAWPTPRASSANGAGEHGRGGPDLQTLAASARPTPTARDHKSGAASKETHDRNSRPLNEVATKWSTPTADDADNLTLASGSFKSLARDASQSARPSLEVQPGNKSSESIPRLNPLFVEWLLGSPFGTTELEPAVMAWIISARRRRSKSS